MICPVCNKEAGAGNCACGYDFPLFPDAETLGRYVSARRQAAQAAAEKFRAAFDEGKAAYDRGEYGEALKAFTAAAAGGFSEAAEWEQKCYFRVAELLAAGGETEKAFTLFGRVSASGTPSAEAALVRLGECAREMGDLKAARTIFEKGNALKIARCAYHLGYMLLAGEGGPRDEIRAGELFEKAAAAGCTEASLKMAELKCKKFKCAEALDYLKSCIPDCSSAEALSAAYKLVQKCMGGEENQSAVIDCFKRLSEKPTDRLSEAGVHAVAGAKCRLGDAYINGCGLPTDFEKGRALIEEAAALGYGKAADYLKALSAQHKE